MTELIGPKPQMPQEPVHPTPWKFDEDTSEVQYVRDANDVMVLHIPGAHYDGLSRMIVDAVNEKYGKIQMKGAHAVRHLRDADDDFWFELTPDQWTMGEASEKNRDVAHGQAQRRTGMSTLMNRPLDKVRIVYGPLKLNPSYW